MNPPSTRHMHCLEPLRGGERDRVQYYSIERLSMHFHASLSESLNPRFRHSPNVECTANTLPYKEEPIR